MCVAHNILIFLKFVLLPLFYLVPVDRIPPLHRQRSRILKENLRTHICNQHKKEKTVPCNLQKQDTKSYTIKISQTYELTDYCLSGFAPIFPHSCPCIVRPGHTFSMGPQVFLIIFTNTFATGKKLQESRRVLEKLLNLSTTILFRVRATWVADPKFEYLQSDNNDLKQTYLRIPSQSCCKNDDPIMKGLSI